jgi:hypothetical protein
MDRYSISPDDEDVVFTRTDTDDSGIWIAPLSKRGAARQLTSSHADNPMFSRKGQILFVRLGGEANYVFSIKPDGTGLRRVIDDPVNSLINISPDGRWILVSRESGEHQSQQILLAYSLDGARPRVLCKSCSVGTLEVMAPPPISWSGDGKAIFVALGAEGTDSEGKTVIIPVNPLELFPRFFEYNSVRELLTSFLPGSKLLQHRLVFPGPNHDTYAVWKVNTQRNLYRISLQ